MSTLKVTNIQDTGGGHSSTSSQIYDGRAKAWCNADLTGAGSIRSSYNVNSLSDGGQGRWTFNFSTAMSDTNYAALGSSKANVDIVNYTWIHPNPNGTYSTTAVKFGCANGSGGLVDPLTMNIVVFSNTSDGL